MKTQTTQKTQPAAVTHQLQVQAYAYLTVSQFCAKHPAFTIGGIRSQIFNESINGLKEYGAIVRNGRKVLIYEPKYFSWLEAKNTERTA